MKRKLIPKEVRRQVYDKYNGHCAYCGCELDIKDMQVDHLLSVYRAEMEGKEEDNSIDNFMPSCRMCNFYKGTTTIEEFIASMPDGGYLNEEIKNSFYLK